MEVNQISQLLKIMGTGASQSTTGVSGNDSSGAASSSFEDLLNQIVSKSQDPTLNNATTSVTSTNSSNNTVSGLDSLSLQSQKLKQLVMQQMMQMMSTQDASSSSSIGSVESDDSSDSLFPSKNSNNDLTQLLKTLVQKQTDTSATTSGLNDSNQVNNVIK